MREADTVAIPRSAIARPKSLSQITSIARAMGLGGRSSPKFQTFCQGLHVLTGKYLDESKAFRAQDPAMWKKCFEEACEQFPFVKLYEDAWPVEAFVRSRLVRTKYNYGKRRSEEHESAVEDDFSPPPQRRRLHSGIVGIDSQEEQTDPAPREQTSHGAHSGAEGSTTYIPMQDKAQSLATSGIEQTTAPDYVKAFLKSIKPPLETLAPKFLKAGITNKACLIGLAEMPDAEKDLLLKEDVRLDAFQFRLVRVALAKLRTE